MHNEKEQEMTSPVSHSQDVQSAIQAEEFIDDELHSQTLGNARPESSSPSLATCPPPLALPTHNSRSLHPLHGDRPTPGLQPGGRSRNVSPSWVVLSPPLYPSPPRTHCVPGAVGGGMAVLTF